MKEKKLGGGILTCSIIYIIFSVWGLYSLIKSFSNLEETRQLLIEGQKALEQSGNTFFKSISDSALAQATTLNISISLVFSIIILASLILILFKKKVGVYSCFIAILLRSIYSVIVSGFNLFSLITLLIGLILPGLLGLFIYKRRSIFGFSNPDEDQAIDA
ncbi:hypothetical protein J1C67_12425 [Clostridium gasigenes]|uniref:hypothetical protein n=1 Tax=Clostridium gasigenes TaxID=94869 RepID=UPI0014382BA0|nr:hypothetical protein [Clostridium gasigenes]MBU3131098.1 hypothetical protein [Clostridium gasigenes]NKF07388.1 hypothetical protein [Clostridium gasigenes]QSW18355.1 hypothetical protein J1C67_12425 [Clostridium gasigenes]